MSTSTQADEEVPTQGVDFDPWEVAGSLVERLEGDLTVLYPIALLAGSMGLGLLISIEGGGGGPQTVPTPGWATILIEAMMPLAVFMLYPIGLITSYVVARWAFSAARTDALLALAIVAGVATATKAASVMLGAIF